MNGQIHEYDGLLFGNGLSLNLISQLQPLIKPDKHYLLHIDGFLKAFITNQLSPREESLIFKLFYDKKDTTNLLFFKKLKETFKQYYTAHDSNIEYWFGADLFTKEEECDYDYPTIRTSFPFLYNIWHEIMVDYLTYLNFTQKLENFEESIKSFVRRDARIFTTNFDRLFEGLKPDHIHGSFVKGIKKKEELIFTLRSNKTFDYKCLWGWNGIGKLEEISKIRKIPGYDTFFDFDFFFDENLSLRNLLVYGVGFQISGYEERLSASIPKYKEPTIGGIVDEHLFIRLNGMQNQRQLKKITFAYYSDSDLRHYEYLSDYFGLSDVDFIKSSSLLFSI
ncbi:hypothetical protein JR338_08185 [Chloroflexota bacterium]|nr:hypothetical protein JR338_08185 [Chloroflexota bacterium]